jgi:putative nucleotidyltransferase with HDIG domain
MPRAARYFSAAVVAAAAVTAACLLPGTDWSHVPRAPFIVLLLLQVALMLTIRLPLTQESPAGPAMVSVLLASIVLLPAGAAALSAAVASSCMVLRRGDPLRVGFACALAFLDAAAGGGAYHAVHGSSVLTSAQFPAALLPIVLAVLALSAVPALVIETFLVTTGRHTAKASVHEGLLRMWPRNIAYAFVGLLTAVLWSDGYDALAALVLLGPIVVTRWATVQYEEQRTAHDAIIRTLVQAVEIKDLYTRGHSERVAKISEMIATELRLPSERVEVLRYAATLHDVGKLGVPTRLLRKTGRLDEKEFEEIRLHPSRGVEVVRDIAFLDEAYSAILHHHERMDGLGYPSGLRGMRIPPFARIIAVADAFDSMTSTRSYRGARGSAEALTELQANAGTQFDPEIVEAIAAGLDRAEREGRPWRGDGTAREGAAAARADLRDLPPGAVVAGFDHDDPAYQGQLPLPMPAFPAAEAFPRPAPQPQPLGEPAPQELGESEPQIPAETAQTAAAAAAAENAAAAAAAQAAGSAAAAETTEHGTAAETAEAAETGAAAETGEAAGPDDGPGPEPREAPEAGVSGEAGDPGAALQAADTAGSDPDDDPSAAGNLPSPAGDAPDVPTVPAVPAAPTANDPLRFAPFGTEISVPAQTGRGPDFERAPGFERGRDVPVDTGSGAGAATDPEPRG